MLERAFNHCHPSAKDNRARVLQYLLPVKMLIGQLPTRCVDSFCSTRCHLCSCCCTCVLGTWRRTLHVTVR